MTLLPIVQQAAARAGGLSALARGLGIRHNSIYRWRQVPPSRVLQIEKLTGISRHDMRPDIYPREDSSHEQTDAEDHAR